MKILNALPPLLRSLIQKSSHFACNSRFSVGGDPVRQVAFGEKYQVRRIHAGREHQQAHAAAVAARIAAAAILKNPGVSREELAHGVREACRALDLDAQRIPDIVAQAERTLKREQAASRAGRPLPEHDRLVEAVGAGSRGCGIGGRRRRCARRRWRGMRGRSGRIRRCGWRRR